MHKIKTSQPEVLWNSKCILGEGVTWVKEHNSLYYVDIKRKKIFKLNYKNKNKKIYKIEKEIGFLAHVSKNTFVLGLQGEIRIVDLKKKNKKISIKIEKKFKNNRINDGKTDHQGRLWFGTMQNNFDKDGESIPIKENIGKLYRVDKDNIITTVEDNLGIPNTFVWSPDNKNFYFTDTLDGNIMKYDYDIETGNLSNKQFFANFDRGFPDGSTMDTDGCLWNCRWGGSCVVRYTPSGEVDQVIEMPVENNTNCVFGGKDLKTLFITSANNPGKNQHELDGSLFSINLNYQGLEDHKSKIQLT